jgi:C4-dicarboxylate-binding protein DctP
MLNASFGFLIASNEWWSKLPADVRAGLMKATDRLVKEQRAEMAQQDAQLLQQIVAKGCQLHTQTPAEEAAWKQALQPVYKEFSPMIGPDLIKEVQQEAESLSKGKK